MSDEIPDWVKDIQSRPALTGRLAERHANDPWPDVPGPQLTIGRRDRELGARFYDRMRGCAIGSAVGDALGAPFEFGPSGAFTKRFPAGNSENEMIGGGLWEPGEFTDDTQMAILEAKAIIETNGDLDATAERSFELFQQWSASKPKDIGISTRSVLASRVGYPDAAIEYFKQNPKTSAGNGSVMRASFAAARWSNSNYTGTATVGRKLSYTTHGDPAAAEGRALLHMVIYYAILVGDESADFATEWVLDYIDEQHRETFRAIVEGQDPTSTGNGTVWGCLRDAFSAVRRTDSFEECMRVALDFGDDVDTVAAVAGAIAGATYGLDAIPQRWVESLHGDVLGEKYRAQDLLDLTEQTLIA